MALSIKAGNRILFGIFFVILLTSLVSSETYSDCSRYGNCQPISTGGGTGGGITNNYYNVTIVNGTSFNDTYAGTTANWEGNSSMVYNHTTAIETLYGKWFYNMTSPFTNWLSTFLYDYNQSDGSYNITYHITTQNWDGNASMVYNHTTIAYGMCMNNASYLTTQNATYDLMITNWNGNSSMVYNHTFPSVAYVDTQLNANFSAYSKFWMNQTAPAIVYTNIQLNANFSAYAKHWYNQTQFTTTATDCTETNKVTDVTYTNGVITTTCGADATGGASPFTAFNITLFDICTNNFTRFDTNPNNQTVSTFSLPANSNVTIECDLWANSSVASIAPQYNFSFTPTAVPVRYAFDVEYFSAVTPTLAYCYTGYSVAPSWACAPTSGSGLWSPYKVKGWIKVGSATTLTIAQKAEVAGYVCTYAGSWCRITQG